MQDYKTPGRDAERRFKRIACSYGFIVHRATASQDQRHIDCILKKPLKPKAIKIEIKARKSVARKDELPQDEWFWIEFRNVRGDPGWLFGDADYVAFEVKEGFLLVNRRELITLTFSLVQNVMVKKPQQARYRLYNRSHRDDLVTMIRRSDVERIAALMKDKHLC